MRRIGRHRHVAARQLVLALRAGLDPRELVLDREIDRLIVAQLEMQERVVLDRAPVAAVERVAADEVDRARDVAPGALRHHQQHLVAHGLADQRIELAREIRPAPFARAGLHVEREERVPDAFGQIGAGEPVHLDAVFQRARALAPDRLALARRERAEEIVEASRSRRSPSGIAGRCAGESRARRAAAIRPPARR